MLTSALNLQMFSSLNKQGTNFLNFFLFSDKKATFISYHYRETVTKIFNKFYASFTINYKSILHAVISYYHLRFYERFLRPNHIYI